VVDGPPRLYFEPIGRPALTARVPQTVRGLQCSGSPRGCVQTCRGAEMTISWLWRQLPECERGIEDRAPRERSVAISSFARNWRRTTGGLSTPPQHDPATSLPCGLCERVLKQRRSRPTGRAQTILRAQSREFGPNQWVPRSLHTNNVVKGSKA